MKTVEILKNDKVTRSMEIEDIEAADLLKRAKLDSEVLTRDNEEEFTARFKPDPVEEIPESIDDPA